ncbi:hypothetical protein ACFLY1_01000 [Patescibacteria group bacterium]
MINIEVHGLMGRKAINMAIKIKRAVSVIGLSDEATTSLNENTVILASDISSQNPIPMPFLRINYTENDNVDEVILALKEQDVRIDVHIAQYNYFIACGDMTL